MENVITAERKALILDVLTLHYRNFCIQTFLNSFSLHQLIFNSHLNASTSSWGFFFPSNTHPPPFQATAWSLIYPKSSPFFSISPLSFLCLLVTWLIPFKQFAGSERVSGDVCLMSHEFKSPLSCKCCYSCGCITPLTVHHTQHSGFVAFFKIFL